MKKVQNTFFTLLLSNKQKTMQAPRRQVSHDVSYDLTEMEPRNLMQAFLESGEEVGMDTSLPDVMDVEEADWNQEQVQPSQ